ncbi:head-tail adaptor [Mycobacterium phage Vincenzo]|uniref:Head-to-tail adaptor n=1 Tax=Mycobacterium phage Vincenzo TaxID=1647301 RepID=A0A0F6YQY8_9CAUD|nr:head-tail adaptor [Mycobacterium phage Vincenzo]AKF14283.1 head-to-tail adaptor [Mycobacterium phage Vincenzo]
MAFTWPVDRSDFPALPDDTDPGYPAAVLEQTAAADLAVRVLHALTGRQFGLHEHTVRPCRADMPIYAPGGVTSYVLSWEGDRWLSWSCGCLGGCKRGGPRQVHLPGPVYDIIEVKIAGVAIPPTTYRAEGNVLYRLGAPWPVQDFGNPAGEARTWTVTYRRGIPVPSGFAALTGLLAKEFLAALNDEGRCRLPRTVTTASRNGVTYRAYDPAVIYANGKTGLPEIDLVLASVNPHALMAAPTVR